MSKRKKRNRPFEVGDVVTWGVQVWAHRVLEVRSDGLVVDAASAGFPKHFVCFAGNNIVLSTATPDVEHPPGKPAL